MGTSGRFLEAKPNSLSSERNQLLRPVVLIARSRPRQRGSVPHWATRKQLFSRSLQRQNIGLIDGWRFRQ